MWGGIFRVGVTTEGYKRRGGWGGRGGFRHVKKDEELGFGAVDEDGKKGTDFFVNAGDEGGVDVGEAEGGDVDGGGVFGGGVFRDSVFDLSGHDGSKRSQLSQ